MNNLWPESRRFARSERGLYFWLFFLIPSEFFQNGERAYGRLAAAAKEAGFQDLVEVFRLEEELGSDFDRRGELIQRSLAIT